MTESEVLASQKVILDNQAAILANQKAILDQQDAVDALNAVLRNLERILATLKSRAPDLDGQDREVSPTPRYIRRKRDRSRRTGNES